MYVLQDCKTKIKDFLNNNNNNKDMTYSKADIS